MQGPSSHSLVLIIADKNMKSFIDTFEEGGNAKLSISEEQLTFEERSQPHLNLPVIPDESINASPDDLARALIHRFAVIFNSKNSDFLKEFFQFNCRSDCDIIHHVYQLEGKDSTVSEFECIERIKQSNPFGPYNDISFPCPDTFMEFMTNWWHMMPNMVLRVINTRVCLYDEQSSLYMMAFELDGTIQTRDSHLIQFQFDHPDHPQWSLIDKVQQLTDDVGQKLRMNGSIAFYLDTNDIVTALEFFYEFFHL